MKKLVLLIFTICMGGGIAASAQEVSQQKLDSLNQVLNDISARVKETEAAENNRAIWKDRAKYFNIAYVNQKLAPDRRYRQTRRRIEERLRRRARLG